MNEKIKNKFYSFTEEIIVVVVMLFIFLPVRIVFYNVVSDNWFGSFGLISGIVVALVLLSKYNKLGVFGRMYWRTITKIHKGKRRIISYLSIGLMLYFWGSVVFGINYAIDNSDVNTMKTDVEKGLTKEDKESLDRLQKSVEGKDIIETQNNLMDQYKSIPPELLLTMIPILFLLPILDITIWATMVSMLDSWFNGWFLHFGTVFFIEALEVVGIMIYTYTQTRNRDIEAD